MIFFAFSVSPPPLAMEKRGAPPVPKRLAKAVMMVMTGSVRPDACQRLGGRVGDVADVDPVHHVVQDIDELCARHGDSQAQDVAGHASLAEITCVRCSRMHGKITF